MGKTFWWVVAVVVVLLLLWWFWWRQPATEAPAPLVEPVAEEAVEDLVAEDFGESEEVVE